MIAHNIFVLFYFVTAVVVLIDLIKPFPEKQGKLWFVLLSIPLVLFATFRPMGVMRDDIYYINIIDWKAENYLSKILSLRDPLYYSVVWVFSAVSRDPELLLFFSGFILLLKLTLLNGLGGSRRLTLLFMYMSIYWQLHDLTQLRVSLSALFFLLFFYLN